MPQVVIFCHGWNCHGGCLWFRKLIGVLEAAGVKCISPTFPEPADPRYPAWRDLLLSMISEHWRDNDIFLVTHSMGGFLVMRFFGDFAHAEWARKCRSAVLVAPPSTRRPDWRPFYDTEIGWEGLRKASISLEFIYSRDDPTVTQEHSAYVQERLRGRDGVVFTFVDGHQHFLVRELPEVILSAVQRMLGRTATE